MAEQSDPGRSTRTLFLVLGLTLVVAVLVTLATGFFPFRGFQGSGDGVDSTTRHADVSVVRFDLDNASVTVRVGGSEVVVQRTVIDGEASETVSDGSLLVSLDCPALRFGCKGEYVVTVPSGTELAGEVSNGRIDLYDIDGRVELETSNGSIDVTGASGEILVLKTSNGSIIGSGLTVPAVDFQTSNGRIEAAFGEAPRSVSARTSNGAIEVTVPSGSDPYAVEASSSNGPIDINIATDPAAERRLELTSSNGRIVVSYAD